MRADCTRMFLVRERTTEVKLAGNNPQKDIDRRATLEFALNSQTSSQFYDCTRNPSCSLKPQFQDLKSLTFPKEKSNLI